MITQNDLKNSERKVYAQHGEDGINELMLSVIGPDSKTFVEIGCGDTSECNCRYLRDHLGFTGTFVDAGGGAGVVQICVQKEVEQQLREAGVPEHPAVLSLDIDGNDWHVMKHLGAYLPTRILIVECNPIYPPGELKVMRYNPYHQWDGTLYFGASPTAFHRLANELGYSFVYVEGHNRERGGVNMYFVPHQFAHLFEGADTYEIYYQQTWSRNDPALPPVLWPEKLKDMYDPWAEQ